MPDAPYAADQTQKTISERVAYTSRRCLRLELRHFYRLEREIKVN